jgi:hypothetical protein
MASSQLIALALLGFTPPRFMRNAEFEVEQLGEMGYLFMPISKTLVHCSSRNR